MTPESIYNRAILYLECNPQAKLKYSEEPRAVLALSTQAETQGSCFLCSGKHLKKDCPNRNKECRKCLLMGHSADDCPTKCYFCQARGHSTKNCYKKKRNLLARPTQRHTNEYRSNSIRRNRSSDSRRSRERSEPRSERRVSFERNRSNSRGSRDRYDRSRSRNRYDERTNFRQRRGSRN